jgi:hypothetical protein
VSCEAEFVRGKWLDPSPGQSSLTHCLDCARVFGAQFNHCDGPPTLLTGFSSLRFFFLFPNCKLVLHGQNLGDVATITAESTTLLKGLKEDFQGCFNQWKRRWDTCIASEGEYFEGEKNYVPDNT